MIVLCFAQYYFLRRYFDGLTVKPTAAMYTLLVYLIITQYFFRTGHRYRFSTIQFAKAFLGFHEYNYYVNGFLVTLNTYSSHLIGFLLLPFFTEKME